jgi:hypothetical protein
MTYTFPDGSPCVDGEVLESEPGRLLRHTWIVRYDPELGDESSCDTAAPSCSGSGGVTPRRW